MRDLLLFIVGNDVVRLEVAVDIDAQPSPFLFLDLLGTSAADSGRSRMWP